MGQVFSIGAICKQTSRPLHRVQYAIESRRIESVGRVGNTRCFDEAGLARIKAALAEIETNDARGRAAAAEPALAGGGA